MNVGATSVLPGKFAAARAVLLADADRIAFIRNYSMMGDPAADAYAALMREFGFRRLVGMLMQACDAERRDGRGCAAATRRPDHATWNGRRPGST